MLTEQGCRERQARLWNCLSDEISWVLVADPRHVYYLCGFLVQPLSFSVNERGWLLLERQGPVTLLADNFTRRSAVAPPFVDREELETWYDHRHSVVNRDQALLRALGRVAPQLQGRSGVVEGEWLPVAAATYLPALSPYVRQSSGELSTLGTLLRQLRRNKHADEIATLELAMAACAAGHAAARNAVQPGVTEFEVYQAIHAAVLAQARKPVQIYGDFRSTNATTPKRGGAPTDTVLAPGDLYLLDYSVIVDGYRSDFTNTVCAGDPSPEQQQLFELCVAAIASGESSLRAGATAVDVYNATAAPLRASSHGESFTHHAGHGLGMAHPEPPILVPESTDVLEAGDVITLEPGLYVPGVGGIRLEHNYLVSATGFRRLSQHSFAL